MSKASALKNSRKKRLLLLLPLLLLFVAALVFFLRPVQEAELLNGGFDELDSEGLPSSWYTDAWFQSGRTVFSVEEGRTGLCAHIRNSYANDARFAQTVPVQPNTLYCLHGYIKTECEEGLGANLSIDGLYVFSDSLYSTGGEWQEVSLYGQTGENQHSVTVFIRLGGYSGEAVGDAWFDDITLTRVSAVPAEAPLTQWYSANKSISVIEADKTPATGAWLLLLACGLYAALFAGVWTYLKRPHEVEVDKERPWPVVAALLLTAFIARLVTALVIPGYNVDIGCFRSWAYTMAQNGPAQFYDATSFCDYPPGYMWILGLIGLIGRSFSGVTEWMVKMPSIVCDVLLCLVLYQDARQKLGSRRALAVSCLYAFNPLTFAAGAAWGQTDSLMLLLIYLTVRAAIRGEWKAALPIYVSAVLVKPQALVFGPLGLVAFLLHLIRERKDKKTWTDAALGLAFSVAAFALIALPFTIGKDPLWLLELYQSTMHSYSHATVNGCNMYFLLGLNWVQTERTASLLCAMLTAVLLTLPPLYVSIRYIREKRSRVFIALPVLFIAVFAVLGLTGLLTCELMGNLVIIYCVLFFGLLFVLSGDAQNLPLLGAGFLILLFSVGTMMHERYLFPAVALLLLAYFIKKDKRILLLAGLISLSSFLNVGCVLDRNIRIGGASGHLNAPACGIESDTAVLEYLSAGLTAAFSLFSSFLCCLLTRKEAAVKELATDPTGKAAEVDGTARRVYMPHAAPGVPRMTTRDKIIMLSVTALYAVLTFVNLGSMKAPQTAFVSVSPDEQILLKLDTDRPYHMLYFGGIHHEDLSFTVATGADGEQWAQQYTADMAQGDCFKWQYLCVTGSIPADMEGPYVRITADSLSLTINEIIFRDAQTNEELTYTVVSDSAENKTAAFLHDEPGTCEGEPGWFNSTYFDEIYHARTAYEHLHHLRPYETTHPPLGKVLMSLFISIFGMTPFGWRFAGALAGVLMLPAMYLMGKLLIRRKWGGAAAILLMVFDTMHFTQTRIATIDSFVVLFILWSVYFMLRWVYMDFHAARLARSLTPLFLSGVFMGLSIASKWTGCYNGVGLAVLFFIGLFRRWQEISRVQAIPVKKRTPETARIAEGNKKLLLTVLSCFVFFIFIPLAIYYCSYIPYFIYNGGVTVKKIIDAAAGMLSYHSTPGLGMDHFFYSPWYQWPIDYKPMWYASNAYEPAGTQSSIMAMGNPAVWWTGLIGTFAVLCQFVKRHVSTRGIELHPETDDLRPALLLTLFLAQFLPWMLVPRGTYIYHYFPSVPFIILALLLALDDLEERSRVWTRYLLLAVLAASAALFVFFFPYSSGVTVSVEWMDAAKLFPNWLWY